jgi:hypothetical protein
VGIKQKHLEHYWSLEILNSCLNFQKLINLAHYKCTSNKDSIEILMIPTTSNKKNNYNFRLMGQQWRLGIVCKTILKRSLTSHPMAIALGFQYQWGYVLIPSLAITHILLLIWMDAVDAMGMVSWPSSSSNPTQGETKCQTHVYLMAPPPTKVEDMHYFAWTKKVACEVSITQVPINMYQIGKAFVPFIPISGPTSQLWIAYPQTLVDKGPFSQLLANTRVSEPTTITNGWWYHDIRK